MPLADRRHTDLVVVLAGIAVLNIANALVLESWAEAAAQLLGTAAAVWFALWRGLSIDELGLSPRAAGAGLRLGAIVTGIIAVSITALVLLPFGRTFFSDDRFVQLSDLEVFYEIGIRIPIVTALTEELLFRSVLLAVLMAIISTRWAVAWSSVVFGLWHVLTTLNGLDGNAATDALSAIEQAASVVAVVVVTLLGGVVFAVARLRSGSIVAPWIIHAALNSTTFSAGVLLAR
jgi:membrane protease YdiL (CAAX protease family)